MGRYTVNWKKYAALCRSSAAEGIVLLRNEENTLPIRKGQRVSVFGRSQLNYYKSGTGSGGMVNTRYVTGLLDAAERAGHFLINQDLLDTYTTWVQTHPFDKGVGWAAEPWSQAEMPVSEELVDNAAKVSDLALIVIGRTAGEDKDNSNTPGSYLLSEDEHHLLTLVCARFEKVAVLLNVGNLMDMRWVEEYQPTAVLYVWQGGQEGGNALIDVLCGKVNPSGRLADTIARSIQDYPSTAHFGTAESFYAEDIYVGYRYFETVAKGQVLYPFGFGLSYTTFALAAQAERRGDVLHIAVQAANTGAKRGKTVAQLYIEAPQGALGQPARKLVGFEKTLSLRSGQLQTLSFTLPLSELASFDDSGVTGYPNCLVLESGTYTLYVGENVRDATAVFSFDLPQTQLVQRLTEALAPVKPFQRMKPVQRDGTLCMALEDVPQRTYSQAERVRAQRPQPRPCTGDQGYLLKDVYDGNIAMDAFLDQLTDTELCQLVRGEGMCSPKVTPGTGGAFGGVTDALLHYGIPVACCTDGPSGLRMDCGAFAMSLPGGTCLACTFNLPLVQQLYEMTGKEMRANHIELLLGPGMNIHRNPLNGRNFEYFSEDPLLTGKMASAMLLGLGRWGVSGTIKHFAGNNQETFRSKIDSIVSQRALREIYLKGYQIAVQEGKALSVMTTYGALNGLWTAGSHDLNTVILRGEWGFDGLVMTDWWAAINDEGGAPSGKNLSGMVRAQNDLYMVVRDSLTHSDNLAEGLQSGAVTRGELLRCAANICNVILRLPVMPRVLGRLTETELRDAQQMHKENECVPDMLYYPVGDGMDALPDVVGIDTSSGAAYHFGLAVNTDGRYRITLRYRAPGHVLAQFPVTVFIGGEPVFTFSAVGTNGQPDVLACEIGPFDPSTRYARLYFAQGGMQIDELRVSLI